MKKYLLATMSSAAIMGFGIVYSVQNLSNTIITSNDNQNKKLNQKNLQIISTTDVESFRGSLFLEFEGQTGTGHLVNNEALNNGINNVILKYGWTDARTAAPSGTVLDYNQLQDLTNGYFLTIDMEAAPDAIFEGDIPQRIYIEIYNLAPALEFPRKINLEKLDDFIKYWGDEQTQSMETYGVQNKGRLNGNQILDEGLEGFTIAYGVASGEYLPSVLYLPDTYVSDYHELLTLQNGEMVWAELSLMPGWTWPDDVQLDNYLWDLQNRNEILVGMGIVAGLMLDYPSDFFKYNLDSWNQFAGLTKSSVKDLFETLTAQLEIGPWFGIDGISETLYKWFWNDWTLAAQFQDFVTSNVYNAFYVGDDGSVSGLMYTKFTYHLANIEEFYNALSINAAASFPMDISINSFAMEMFINVNWESGFDV